MPTDSAFFVWISNYGQMVLFFAQLLFWVAVGVAAVWSTLIFRRFVNAKVGVAEVAKPAVSAAVFAPSADAEPVSVDEFVD